MREKKGKEGRKEEKAKKERREKKGEEGKVTRRRKREKKRNLPYSTTLYFLPVRCGELISVLQSCNLKVLHYTTLPPEGYECDEGGEVLHVCIVLQLPHL